MPKIIIPTPLRQYAGKQEAIELKAATVGELLTRLVTTHADLRRHLYTDDGKLRSFVNVYLNDEDIRYLQKENTPVKESDVVSIVPSIAGGSVDVDLVARKVLGAMCGFLAIAHLRGVLYGIDRVGYRDISFPIPPWASWVLIVSLSYIAYLGLRPSRPNEKPEGRHD
ncbi:MAG: MoaD/ThiS family protein [Candidatus Acidiferrales bacterium]